MMHQFALLALLLVALAARTSAFVPPVPASSSRIISSSTRTKQQQQQAPPATVARLSPMDVADVLVAAAAEGEYEYGAVAAPGGFGWMNWMCLGLGFGVGADRHRRAGLWGRVVGYMHMPWSGGPTPMASNRSNQSTDRSPTTRSVCFSADPHLLTTKSSSTHIQQDGSCLSVPSSLWASPSPCPSSSAPVRYVQ